MSIRIVLVDDHPIVRDGLRSLLHARDDFVIVGEVSSGSEALRLLENAKPDLLIVDLMMSGVTGLEVVRQARQVSPETRIVIFSMYSDEGYILEAIKSGAKGYVFKGSDSTELIRAIREVMADRYYLSGPLSGRVLEWYIQKDGTTEGDPYEVLTTREREVFRLAAQGLTNVGIAAALNISPRTAEIHRANMMRKLGLQNQTDLVRYAIRRGVVPVE